MGPGIGRPRHVVPLVVLAAAAAGCRVAGAKVANLRELHDPDGSPRRVGVVQGDRQYVVRRLLGGLGLLEPEAFAAEPERIEDPLGTCLENCIGLADCGHDDPRVVALQAELFSWLAVDCTYVLTRERCLLALADVGRALDVEGPAEPLADDEAIGPDEALAWLVETRPVVEPFVAGGAPAPSAERVRAAAEAIDSARLDRDGARRLLGALNRWAESPRFAAPELRELRGLWRDLARRSVALALGAAFSDPEARPRAAALATCVELTDNGLPGLLRAAIADRDELVVTRAARLIAVHGLPDPEPDFPGTAEDYRAAWNELLVRLLRVAIEGPASVAACRALARTTDAGFEDLRPEVWIAWWERRHAPELPEAEGGPTPAAPAPPGAQG